MTRPQFRYRRASSDLYVGTQRIDDLKEYQWFAPVELVADCSLASLRQSLATATKDQELSQSEGKNQVTFGITPARTDNFNERTPSEHITKMFALENDRLMINVWLAIGGTDLSQGDVELLISPVLKNSNTVLQRIQILTMSNQEYAFMLIDPRQRGVTVGDMVTLADNIGQLLLEVRGHHLTAKAGLSLLRAGRCDLLIGLPESSWLEAKSQGYDLSQDYGQIELAQDVARFANGDEDGLLVLGLRTKKQAGLDTISTIVPRSEMYDTARYHNSLDRKVFPPIVGLVVENVRATTANGTIGHLLAIFVPQQPEEAKPVLVHGAIVGKKVEGAFISIIQRRGEHSVPVRPEAIHSTLAAGRALLRRGEISPAHPHPPSVD